MLKPRVLLLIGIGLFMVLLFFTTSFLPSKVEKVIPELTTTVRAEDKGKIVIKEKKKITSVEWKGTIYRDLETHYYLFSTTKKGKVQVTWGPNTDGSDFIITDKSWSVMYHNGDILPKGDYMFVITSNPAEFPDDPARLNYHFTLEGVTFKEAPNTTLPQLTIDSPTELVAHFPVGEHTLTFKGASNTSSIVFGTSGADGIEVTETLSSPFVKTVQLDENSPLYSSYRISATNEVGNSVNKYFEVIYDGGTSE